MGKAKITHYFNRFLADIWDEEEKAFNPEQLFEQVSKKYLRFSRGEQQDAHDLFISLIDLIDSEHLRLELKDENNQTLMNFVFGFQFCN